MPRCLYSYNSRTELRLTINKKNLRYFHTIPLCRCDQRVFFSKMEGRQRISAKTFKNSRIATSNNEKIYKCVASEESNRGWGSMAGISV